jgi:hypothetical protein
MTPATVEPMIGTRSRSATSNDSTIGYGTSKTSSDVVGKRAHERLDLSDQRRDRRGEEPGDHQQDHDGDHGDRQAAPEAAPGQPRDRQLQADGEELVAATTGESNTPAGALPS